MAWSDGKQAGVPELLACLRDAMCRKRPELWKNQTWMLHHYNAPAPASLFISSYPEKHQTSIVAHPPYSPELHPADIFLFPKLKTVLRTSFPSHRVDSRTCQLHAITECVPGSISTIEETLGTVYRQ